MVLVTPTRVDRFAQLTQLVKEDKELQEELKAVSDQASWILRVVQFGEAQGIHVTASELTERIKAKAAQRIDFGSALEILHAMSHSPSSAQTTPW